MEIRDAQQSDKNAVLDFCKNTFSWGDYIADVWDLWISEGNLFVAADGDAPIGLCHIVLTDDRQAWMEGIRIHPDYRRKEYGKKIIAHCESITKSKVIRMIIESQNIPSIGLSQSMGYYVEDKWQMYSLIPKKETSTAIICKDINNVHGLVFSGTYASSWRWLSLKESDLEKLINQKQVLISLQNGSVLAVGIWNKSENYANVLQLGYVNGSKEGILDILHFIQNKGYELNSERIQVFSQEKNSLEMDILTKKSLFYLMRKDLVK